MDGHLIGLLGAGIGPSLSPALHEREAAELGLRLTYRRIDLDVLGRDASATGELLAAARAVGFDGLNTTHPCKQAVLQHVDALTPDAAALGAVNTVTFSGAGRPRTTTGHNTDWSGFSRSFARGLPGAALERVVLLGAGGAGAAVGHALVVAGTRHLVVVDADAGRAAALAASLDARSPGGAATSVPLSALPGAVEGADGLVHATPTGMAAHPGSPVPDAVLRPDLWVADVVYRPLETELVRRARAAGCPVLDGGGMAVFQAAEAFALFTGVAPDAERMLAHFAELVTAERPGGGTLGAPSRRS